MPHSGLSGGRRHWNSRSSPSPRGPSRDTLSCSFLERRRNVGRLETAAKICGASAIPLWIGASGEPLSLFCFYVLLAVPLFSIATAMSRSERKLCFTDAVWHVPDLFAWFVVLGFASYAAGLLLRTGLELHPF